MTYDKIMQINKVWKKILKDFDKKILETGKLENNFEQYNSWNWKRKTEC